MTRAEHLAWCKERALEYLDMGDRVNAMASMISDLGKHPETARSLESTRPIALFELVHGDERSIRSFIEDFD
jgi:hypothetical protein